MGVCWRNSEARVRKLITLMVVIVVARDVFWFGWAMMMIGKCEYPI